VVMRPAPDLAGCYRSAIALAESQRLCGDLGRRLSKDLEEVIDGGGSPLDASRMDWILDSAFSSPRSARGKL